MKYLLANLLFWFTALGFALKTEASLPIQLEANNARFNRHTGINIYEGQVIALQGTATLNADQVTTYSDEKNNLKELIAMGNPARYTTQLQTDKPPLIATAQTIKYHLKEGYIELIGHAHAQQGADTIQGPHLIYQLAEQTLSAPTEPAGRTTITLHPKKEV